MGGRKYKFFPKLCFFLLESSHFPTSTSYGQLFSWK